MTTKPQSNRPPSWRRTAKATTATAIECLLVMLALPTGQSDPIEISGQLLNTECAALTENESTQETLRESPWSLSESLDGGKKASKEVTVAFTSQSTSLMMSEEDGEPGVEIQNCSAGACNVVVHVYEKTVVSAKAHAGLFAFLPWAYAKVTVTQETQVTEESEITCTGTAVVYLKGFGGVGPRSFSSSIWKNQAHQYYQQCHYLNVPQVSESCTIFWEKDFEIQAKTPGKYTRFDVINGGGLTNVLSANAVNGLIGTMDTPDVEVDSLVVDGLLDSSGKWTTVFSGIEIDVDTEEALALILGDQG